jgi:hypothetical protein
VAFRLPFVGVCAGAALFLLGVAGLAAAAAVFLGVLPTLDLAFGVAGAFAAGVAVRLTAVALPFPFPFPANSSASSGLPGEELNPLTGTFVVVVRVANPLKGGFFCSRGRLSSSSSSTEPSSPTIKFRWILPLPLGVSASPSPPSSRSASTITLMRHGESTELDVAVILAGEWIITVEVLRFLDGVAVRCVGVAEDRFDTERACREGSEMEGPVGAESGSGEEERVDIAEGHFISSIAVQE